MLIKVNNGSRQMNASEEKAWMHFLSGDPMFRDFLQKQAMHGVDPTKRTLQQPVCPKCERACFHHKDGIACNHCGYTGPMTMKAKLYLKEGWYR